jgi:hypothetical protein
LPARQACRAATLGDSAPAATSSARSALATLLIDPIPFSFFSTALGTQVYHNV